LYTVALRGGEHKQRNVASRNDFVNFQKNPIPARAKNVEAIAVKFRECRMRSAPR